MSYAVWQRTITDGDVIIPNASMEVRRSSTSALASIFEDRDGNTAITQPGAEADSNGFFQFYAAPGRYDITATDSGGNSITWKDVLIGTVHGGDGLSRGDFLRYDTTTNSFKAEALHSPATITDGGTDAYTVNAGRVVGTGETFTGNVQSPNGTTTPTLDNQDGADGPLTVTTKDGSALWANALSGTHDFEKAASSWLVLDPNPTSSESETADDALATLAAFGINTGELSGTGIPGAIGRGAIVESGNNSNGSYVRWANGEQVCFNLISETKDIDTTSGNVNYSAESTWTYPAEFNSASVRGWANEGGTVATWAQAKEKTATTLKYRYFRGDTETALSVTVYLLAIGFWK